MHQKSISSFNNSANQNLLWFVNLVNFYIKIIVDDIAASRNKQGRNHQNQEFPIIKNRISGVFYQKIPYQILRKRNNEQVVPTNKFKEWFDMSSLWLPKISRKAKK